MSHSAPLVATPDGLVEMISTVLGNRLISIEQANEEVAVHIQRDALVDCMLLLRDECEYQQLMEIAGVDWPDREPRFELVYCLLSLTKNHRIRVHLATNDSEAVQSVTSIWPVAGWLEREVFDMYGVLFSGNSDLRRILTDYGFSGHPQRKDFPLSGYVELRYSEEEKRVKYEPVQLPQDFRNFDFLSPWEGADYVLPGDEKTGEGDGKGATQRMTAQEVKTDPVAPSAPPPGTPKTTDKQSETGAGKSANKEATKRSVRKPKATGDKA